MSLRFTSSTGLGVSLPTEFDVVATKRLILSGSRNVHWNSIGRRVSLLQLPEMHLIEELDVAGDWIEGLEALKGASSLKRLSIYFERCEGDLSGIVLPNLSCLYMRWRPALQPLLSVQSLRSLVLLEFRDRELDCGALSKNLVHLALINLRSQTVHDIASLMRLVSLELDSCRGVTDLGFLNGLRNLRSVILTNLRNVHSYEKIGKCKSLEFIAIENAESASVSSVKWIRNLPSIRYLSLRDTHLVDGKLAFLKKMPCFRCYAGPIKRHYDVEMGDLPSEPLIPAKDASGFPLGRISLKWEDIASS